MDLSRVQICDRFGLRAASFDAVSPLLSCKPVADRGRIIYPLAPKDEFVLGCARVHGASFCGDNKNIHTLPFHRFLCLRFITSSLQETVLEINQRYLANGFDSRYLGKLFAWFVKRLPEPVRAAVKRKLPESAEETEMVRTLLKVIGILWAYDNPQWVDGFFEYFHNHEAKKIFELALTTKGTRDEKQLIIEELLRVQWQAHPIDLYECLLYDLGVMTEKDWAYYKSVLLPSDAKAYEEARNETTSAFITREGMKPHFDEMRKFMACALEKKIHGLLRLNDGRSLGTSIAAYTKLVEMEGGGGSTSEGYFSGIRIGSVHHPGGDEAVDQDGAKAAEK